MRLKENYLQSFFVNSEGYLFTNGCFEATSSHFIPSFRRDLSRNPGSVSHVYALSRLRLGLQVKIVQNVLDSKPTAGRNVFFAMDLYISSCYAHSHIAWSIFRLRLKTIL
jgi:hypothetical protein